MGTYGINIFSRIGSWCGSITGILTIFVIATAINRMVLTAIREKHSKESLFYRNSKLISGTLYLIFFINCLGAICRRVLQIGMQTKAQIDTATIENTGSAIRPAVLIGILAIIYVAMISNALKHGRGLQIWIATITLISCVQIILSAPGLTIAVGILAILLALSFCVELESTNYEDSESKKITKKGIFTAVAWIISVAAAYMAGEYSLIPKAIEYIQNRFDKEKKAATEDNKDIAKETVTE